PRRGALDLQRLCQHRSGSAAQSPRDPPCDPYRAAREYVPRGHGPFRRRARLRRNGSEDATASHSPEEMHAALDINLPNYVNAIVTTSQITEAISSRPAAHQVTGSRRSGSTR